MTVIVLIILASITTYSGLNSMKNAKFTKFKTNLEIMQSQVNLLSEKYKEKIEEAEKNGTQFTAIGNDPTDLFTDEDEVIKFLQDVKDYDSTNNAISVEKNDYRYFNKDLLKEIGIENTDTEFLVDLENRIVIATQPIKYEGKLYYTINQIKQTPTTGGLVRNENVTVENVTYNKTNTGYEITLENVQCSKYVAKYDVQYKEANDSTYKIERGITENKYTFKVDKCGLYFIKVTDAAGRTTARKDIVVSIYDGVKFSSEAKVKMVKSITDDSVTVEDVTIPAGFTISGVDSECAKTVLGVDEANKIEYTIDDGVVIYLNPSVDWTSSTSVDTAQTKYDQFVWVPVPNAVLDLSSNTTALSSEANIKAAVQSEIDAGRYPMAIKKDETNYFGVLYQFSLVGNAVKVEPYDSWTPLSTSDYREPSAVTYFDKSTHLPQVNGILNTSYSYSTSFGNALQAEFNTMVNRVASNKGFWVGRYETSKMSDATTTTYDIANEIKVNVVKGTTDGINNVTWYRMYAQQKLYSKKANITATSSMIWGSQWDQIMIWMKTVKNTINTTNGEYYVINAVGMGNFGTISGVDDGYSDTSNPAATGCFKVKNVYDLAGNVCDWSLEAYSTAYRVIRRRLLRQYE